MLNFCGIVVAILKMATGRNFSMSGMQFCVFKIFEMSAIFKMAPKTRHKKWEVKIQHCPPRSAVDKFMCHGKKERRRIIIIIKNGAKTISIQRVPVKCETK
jgi:hypothetical protein